MNDFDASCARRTLHQLIICADQLIRCVHTIYKRCASDYKVPNRVRSSQGDRREIVRGIGSDAGHLGVWPALDAPPKMISIVFLVTNSLLEPTRNKMEVSCVSLCVMPIRASPQMQWILMQICYMQILQRICPIHLKAAAKLFFSIATFLHCSLASLCFLSCRKKIIEQFN